MNFLLKASVAIIATAASLTACSTKQSSNNANASTSQSTAAPNSAMTSSLQPSATNRSSILAAAEPFETLTEQAPTASKTELLNLIAKANQAAQTVSPSLDPQHQADMTNHLKAISGAQTTNNRTEIALASVEAYRTLVESAGDAGKIPQAVSLLDYSGFRYQADLSARPVRWSDSGNAVMFAEQKWASISDRVTDTTLKSEFSKSLEDMKSAQKASDVKAAKAASTKELDLVDKLESFFSKQ
ncbi:hypothetical protein GRI58_14540 [Porphyrobacter algicida]|uniref:Lipoprotein n=1 Tax=Qipengyuania algicida TaxID=1836209 RepID=A0A845AMB3_9SPHN|nr:hypothetical protein [Qipengyuania algicida]MXP30025.1 hypothetical protein [Qipengyuania algicida]